MFVQQLIASLKWIRKYIRAYTLLRLVPEMGNGRLHYHFCGIVKDPMKHKILCIIGQLAGVIII